MKPLSALLAAALLPVSAIANVIHYECNACQHFDKKYLYFSWPAEVTNPKISQQIHRSKHYYPKHWRMIVQSENHAKAIKLPRLTKDSVLHIKEIHANNTSDKAHAQLSLISLSEANSLNNINLLSQSEDKQHWYYHASNSHETLQVNIPLQSKNVTYQIDSYQKTPIKRLGLRISSPVYQYGDTYSMDIDLSSDDLDYPIASLEAEFIKPDNTTVPLEIERYSDWHYKIQKKLSCLKNYEGIPWRLKVTLSQYVGEDIVTMNAIAPFTYTLPSAEIIDSHIEKKDNLWVSQLQVHAGTSSRFRLDGTLVGLCDGIKKPIMYAQSAAYLEKDKSTKVPLKFELDKLKSKNCKPQSIENVVLHDLGQLKPIQFLIQPQK